MGKRKLAAIFRRNRAVLPVNAGSTPAGGGSPAPDLSNLQYIYRADMGTFQDTAETTPATADGATVLAIKDQSGNGNDLWTATGPILKLNQVNGLPCLRFDGTSQFFYFINPYIAANRTIYGLFKIPGASTYTIINGNSGTLQWRISGNVQQLVSADVALIGSGSTSITNNTWTQCNVSWDGANGIFRTARAVDTTLSTYSPAVYGENRWVGVNHANNPSPAEFFATDLAVLLEYATVHNVSQKQAVEAWINGIWGS